MFRRHHYYLASVSELLSDDMLCSVQLNRIPSDALAGRKNAKLTATSLELSSEVPDLWSANATLPILTLNQNDLFKVNETVWMPGIQCSNVDLPAAMHVEDVSGNHLYTWHTVEYVSEQILESIPLLFRRVGIIHRPQKHPYAIGGKLGHE